MKALQELVRHLYDANKELALKRSLKHCHIKGLHSVVLSEAPDGSLVRVFYATREHELLWPGDIAYHTHHCDLSFAVLGGTVVNWTPPTERSPTRSVQQVCNYKFSSVIRDGQGGFERVGEPFNAVSVHEYFSAGDTFTMKAEVYHSVTVPQLSEAAWMLVEGEEDENFESVVYSPLDLDSWTADGLYEPFENQQELDQVVDRIINL